MFKKILIANRGEIALRVIWRAGSSASRPWRSTRRRTSIRCTCASPTKTSASARRGARDSYLNVPAIISAAEITGADAIHPGYGFLSESAYLAEVCEACHIRFIGPDTAA